MQCLRFIVNSSVLFYFLLSVVISKYNITSFIQKRGSCSVTTMVLAFPDRDVCLVDVTLKLQETLCCCVLFLYFGGVYWVQVVMECLVFAFVLRVLISMLQWN